MNIAMIPSARYLISHFWFIRVPRGRIWKSVFGSEGNISVLHC